MPDQIKQPMPRALVALLAALALSVAAVASADAQSRTTGGAPAATLPAQATPPSTAFDSNGMWIWELGHSSGGNLDAIALHARAAGIGTVFVKSSDAGHAWRQFNRPLVRGLHARGLRACAWGYVYGNSPAAEARAARVALRAGADCFVIDAEAEYEGKYISAGTYMRALRTYAGPNYPIGLAGFPYVDYHPAFPYSVFLGPGGAQFNLPQMYWHAIGTSVDAVFAHTYAYNTPYARPVYPLGQTYGGTPRSQIVRFRQFARAYGARGVSWWSWQETPARGWSALASPLAALSAASPPPPIPTTLRRGARGDLVVWAQQHLLTAGEKVPLKGVLDARTQRALKHFQATRFLPATGSVDPATWSALLGLRAAKVRWRAGGAVAAARSGTVVARPPISARLPARRDELRGVAK